jgi:uncharacterized protein YciI
MSYFVVIREAGRAWTDGGMAEQPGMSDHAAFMNALADQGFALMAGPLAGSEHGRLRAMLLVDAEGEAEIHRRLVEDPWTRSEQLQITSIEPWNTFVGAQRLSATPATNRRGRMSLVRGRRGGPGG